MWLSLMASPWKTDDKTTNAMNIIVVDFDKTATPYAITHLNQSYTLRRQSAGIMLLHCRKKWNKQNVRREKKNERSRSVTQCNAAHAIQAFVLVLSAFSSACVHSLLLEPCNRTNTPTTVNFQLKLDVCGKVTSRLLLSFLLMRITIWKMKRKITEKPQNLNSNAPEFIWKCNSLLKSHQCGQVPYTRTHIRSYY